MPDPASRDPMLEAYQRQAAITMGLANVIAEVAPDVDDWVRSKLSGALRLACAQSAALIEALDAAQADRIRRDG